MWMLLAVLLADGPLAWPTAQAAFRLPDGYRVELVAAEPLVVDPVAIDFDERGRMYVAEYRDYPTGAADGTPLSRVALLADDDGDGRMDRRDEFATVPWVQGVMCWKGGVIVTAAPQVLFLKDTTGDGVADQRRVLLEGFQPGNPQLRTACPRLGPDGWIYLANGLSGGEVSAPGSDDALSLDPYDLAFHPETLELKHVAGRGQFGQTFDAHGTRYFCTNRNPVITARLPKGVIGRNPYLPPVKIVEDLIEWDSDDPDAHLRVYPAIEQQTTAASHAGTHTAACGIFAARDGSDEVYVCEPTAHLVTRSTLDSGGTERQLTAAGLDFLTSTDRWFRPVSVIDGPHPGIYVVDMYRQVIEHPEWMPDGLAETLPLRAGDDRGRIWRVVADAPPPVRLWWRPTPFDTGDPRIDLLFARSGWQRATAFRLLVQSPIDDVAGDLRRLWDQVEAAQGTVEIDAQPIFRAFDFHGRLIDDNWPTVLRHAGPTHPMIERLLPQRADVREAVFGKARDVGTALAAAAVPDDPLATAALVDMLAGKHREDLLTTAVLTSCARRSAAVAAGLVADESFFGPAFAFASPGPLGMPSRDDTWDQQYVLGRLAVITGCRGDASELTTVMELIARDGLPEWVAASLLTGLGEGIARGNGRSGYRSLAALLDDPQPERKAAVTAAHAVLDAAAERVADRVLPESHRVAALRLLALRPLTQVRDVLADLLTLTESVHLQRACVDAVAGADADLVADLLIGHWNGLAPSVREPAMSVLLRRTSTASQTLDAIASGKLPRSAVPTDQRDRLRASKDEAIRTLASDLFTAASPDRRQVIEQYRPALVGSADIARGEKVFVKTCAKCHRRDGVGTDVGPTLADTRGRTAEALLTDILDPNHALEPRYAQVMIVTDDGETYTGLIYGQTSKTVTLVQPGEESGTWISRDEIAAMKVSDKSLMPEGLEREIDPQQMADLIAYLRGM